MVDTGGKVQVSAVDTAEQVAAVVAVASEIWIDHYVPIIGRAQVDYMLHKFQSSEAVQRDLAGGYAYFGLYLNDQLVGYLSLLPDDAAGSAFLSKFYIHRVARGAGLGLQAINFVLDHCREAGLGLLWLTVNKHNSDSIAWYKRQGFEIAGDLVMDIGGGYVMDDYRMERVVGQ